MSRVDGSDSDGDTGRRRRLLDLVTATATEDVSTLVSAEPVAWSGAGSWPRSRGLMQRLARVCAVSLAEVGVSGAGVTVMGDTAGGLAGHRAQLWSTGPLTRRLEDLQLTMGEGPCLDAYSGGSPVLAGDLGALGARWLGFTPEALAAGAAAVFSLPLQVGAVQLGTFDLNRDRAGELDGDQFANALVLAALATETLLDMADERDEDGETSPDHLPGWLPDVHAEVHQASGMVAARERIPVASALLRIRAHAVGHDLAITEVARRILARSLVLPTDSPDPPGPEPAERSEP